MGTIKRVLASVAQALTSQEQKQARENIGITELIKKVAGGSNDFNSCSPSNVMYLWDEWATNSAFGIRANFDDDGLLDVTLSLRVQVNGEIIYGDGLAYVIMLNGNGEEMMRKEFRAPVDSYSHIYDFRFTYRSVNKDFSHNGIKFKVLYQNTCYNKFSQINNAMRMSGVYYKEPLVK